MTIVEEIDKKANNPHRSRNITEALKNYFGLETSPRNIGEAFKMGAEQKAAEEEDSEGTGK